MAQIKPPKLQKKYKNKEHEEAVATLDDTMRQFSEEEMAEEAQEDYTSILRQIANEKKLAEEHMELKYQKWRVNLSLYHNARRDAEATGDPLMFTLIQTMLAALYDDRQTVEFVGREEGDDETAESLNGAAEYDYEEMEKATLDLTWIFDSLFFGRGLVWMYEFIRDAKNKVFNPLPSNIDPLCFLRDPDAISVNGDAKGRGALRFGGVLMSMTKYELERDGLYDHIDEIKTEKELDSIKNQSQQARDAAQGRDNTLNSEDDLGDNTSYDITLWFTHYKGKKMFYWLANDGALIIRQQECEYEQWPIIDRPLYPIANDWDGVSIPDLVEDKQRARAIVQNLGIKILKADLYPMYVYNEQKIQNKADLNFDFNKFIPAKGDVNGALLPITKAQTNHQFLSYMFEMLDVAGQKATATPEIQQGVVANEKRTLGEINLVAAKADTRYSLAARIFMISEKKFWQQWYRIYKEHFDKDIDEKIIRVNGVFGQKWRGLDRTNMIANIDPDIVIESRILSEQRRERDLQITMQYANLLSTMPDSNQRYIMKKVGKLAGFKKEEIDRFLPPTVDELIAEQENDMLNDNKYVEVQVTDNHTVHLEYHAKTQPTAQAIAHIAIHQEALRMQRDNPELFPQLQSQGIAQGATQGGAPVAQGGAPNQAPNLNEGVPVPTSQGGIGQIPQGQM